MKTIYFILLIALLASCAQQSQTKPPFKEIITVKDYFNYNEAGVKEAGVKMIPVKTPSGEYKVWTKRIGNNPKIKVLLLHGGPAITHEYFECFESFLPAEGIEFYYYDQLGSYYSEQPKDSNLWTLTRFVEEVEQVRVALGLNNTNCYLLGQSWGGILAMQYALKYQNNIKALIVSNMMASFPAYGAYNAMLRAQLRPSLIDTLERYEKANLYFDPVYQQLVMDEFYRKHICRVPVWPDGVQRTFKHLNPDIYVLMQGPSEFVPGGRLKNWDVMNQLQNITIPTLMIGANYDTMDPKAMEEQSKRVKNGRYLYCPNGSHLAMWDDQPHFFPGLIQFLRDVDEGRM
jgi:proline iminopeptidase